MLAATAETDTDLITDEGLNMYYKQVTAAVDEILKFEKVRQNVAFKNCLPSRDGHVVLSPSRMMRTSGSVPNMRQSISSSLSSDSLSRLKNSQTLNDLGSDQIDGRRSSTPSSDALRRRVPVSGSMLTVEEESIMSSGYQSTSHNMSNSTMSSQSSIEHD